MDFVEGKLSAGPSSYVLLPWISLSLVLVSEVTNIFKYVQIARGFSRGAFELLPYSEKENHEEKETESESPQIEGSPKLHVFPIKKWMSRAKRAK